MRKVIVILHILLFMKVCSDFIFNDKIILREIYKDKKIYTDVESKKFILTKNKEKRYKRTQIADYKITGNKIFVLLESKEAADNGKILDYNGNIGEFDYAVLEISKDKNIVMKKRGEMGVFGAGTDIFTGDENIKFIPVGKETEGMEISMKFSKDSEYTNSTVFEFDPEKNNMSQLFSVEGYSYCSFLCEITEENYEFSEEGEKRNYDLKIENNFYIEDTGLKNAAEKTFIFKKTIKYYAFENGKYILKKEEKSPKYLFSKNDEAVLAYLYGIHNWDTNSLYDKYYINQDMEDFTKLFKTIPKVKKNLEIKTYISHIEDRKDGLLVTLKHILHKEENSMEFDIENVEIIEEQEERVFFKKEAKSRWVLDDMKKN